MTFFRESSVCICIGCGCDDNNACLDENTDDPCYWERVDRQAGLGVCSCCADQIEGWDAGDRKIKVPVEMDSEVVLE